MEMYVWKNYCGTGHVVGETSQYITAQVLHKIEEK